MYVKMLCKLCEVKSNNHTLELPLPLWGKRGGFRACQMERPVTSHNVMSTTIFGCQEEAGKRTCKDAVKVEGHNGNAVD